MDRRLRNRIVIFLALAAIVAFALVRLSGRQPVAKISAVTPIRENVISSISSNGKVEPIAPSIVRAQLDTFIERISAVEGQPVRKGQLLLELNVKDASAQLADARSKLLRAEDDLRAAHAGGRADEAARTEGQLAATKDELAANDLDLAKAEAQVKQLTAAKQEFEHGVKLDANRTTLQVEQLRSVVASLEEKVRDGRISAPADGTLYALPVRVGDYVKVGDLLAEMADLHKVRVRAFIDEPELGGLEPGEPVRITWDALPNRNWMGKTQVIPKQVVARGARSVGELLCEVNNDKLELLPNINVNVRINSRERINVLTVPRGAVDAQGGRRFVFVVLRNALGVGKATLQKREIRVGIADAANYEVLDGLQEGEMVALPGDVDLKDGMPVKITNTDASYVRGRSESD